MSVVPLILCLVAAVSSKPLAPYAVSGSSGVAGPQALLGQDQATSPPTAAPTPWRAEIAASVRAPFGRLLLAFIRLTPHLIAAGLIVLVLWWVAAFVRWLTQGVVRIVPDRRLQFLLVQISYWGVWVIGAVALLDTPGVDARAMALGVGLTSIALGFALKDILSNLVSGQLLMVSRSFEIGDQITVGGTEGTVEAIGMRVTHIRTDDGRLALVPNTEVFTSRVVNHTASPLRRASIIVPIDSRQDLRLACRTIDEAARSTTGVAADPPPSVRLCDLTPGQHTLEARFWTDADRSDFVTISCNVRAAIVDALKEMGIETPNPDVRRIATADVEHGVRGTSDRRRRVVQ